MPARCNPILLVQASSFLRQPSVTHLDGISFNIPVPAKRNPILMVSASGSLRQPGVAPSQLLVSASRSLRQLGVTHLVGNSFKVAAPGVLWCASFLPVPCGVHVRACVVVLEAVLNCTINDVRQYSTNSNHWLTTSFLQPLS